MPCPKKACVQKTEHINTNNRSSYWLPPPKWKPTVIVAHCQTHSAPKTSKNNLSASKAVLLMPNATHLTIPSLPNTSQLTVLQFPGPVCPGWIQLPSTVSGSGLD